MDYPRVVYLPFDISPAILIERFDVQPLGWQGGYDEDYKKWIRWGIYSVAEARFEALIKEMQACNVPYKVRG